MNRTSTHAKGLRGWHQVISRALALTYALTLLVTVTSASSLARRTPLSQLDVRKWTMADGAPTSAWAIAQTNDGWLWFGAPSGLFRFDGLRFDSFDLRLPELRSESISALYATRDGRLLIGYLDGGVSMVSGEDVTHFAASPALGHDTVYSLTMDRAGVVWVATRAHLLRFDGTSWEAVGEKWGFPDGYCINAFVDRRGKLWVSTKDKVLSLAPGDSSFKLRQSTGEPSELIESPDGQVWSSSAKLLESLDASAPKSMPSEQLASSRASFVSLFDRDGAFWIATDDLLARLYRPAAELPHAPVADPLVAAAKSDSLKLQLKTLLEDREGNLWASTETGILRIRRTNVASLDVGDGGKAPHFAAFAITGDGSLWMASRSSGLAVSPGDGLWRRTTNGVERVQPLELPAAFSATTDADGLLWVAGNDALWHQRPDGRLVRDRVLPTSWGAVSTMATDGSGDVWVSVLGQGVFKRAEAGQWLQNGGLGTLPNAPATVMKSKGKGELWLGYGDGSVRILDRAATGVQVIEATQLKVGAIKAISLQQTVLIAGEHGLAKVGPDLTTAKLNTAGGLRHVTGIAELEGGDVWLNTRDGALRVPASSMKNAVDRRGGLIEAEVLSGSDGYPGSGASSYPLAVNSMIQASDGLIWLNGNVGIGSIDPARVERNMESPRVALLNMQADGKRLQVKPHMSLPPGTHQLQIGYTSLSFSQPERQTFRYRLSGVDHDWTQAGSRREAIYTNLGPGHYRFEAIAENENGVPSEAPASLDFEISPTLIQTRSFFVACLATILTLLVLLVRHRDRFLAARERRRLEIVIGERERIARELHDTLLQGTQGLVLTVGSAVKQIAPEAPARQMLERALKTADQVMNEGRLRIQDLRAPGEASGELPAALSQLGKRLEIDRKVRIEVSVEGSLRQLQTRVADEAFQIGREALINACQHADAYRIEVQIVYGDGSLRLKVRDDGCGFEREAAEVQVKTSSGHWGLAGMGERARSIGGELAVWSRKGAGTEVEFGVPASIAYIDDAPQKWSFWKR